jgi:hypothetical protein
MHNVQNFYNRVFYWASDLTYSCEQYIELSDYIEGETFLRSRATKSSEKKNSSSRS